MRKDLTISGVSAAVALLAAALCHAFFPGLGAVLKPLLWPLVPLAIWVRPRVALPLAALLPFLSAWVNGMPHLGIACVLALASVAVLSAVALVKAYVRNRLAVANR